MEEVGGRAWAVGEGHAELNTTCGGWRDGPSSTPIALEIHFDQSEARTGSGLADRSRPNR